MRVSPGLADSVNDLPAHARDCWRSDETERKIDFRPKTFQDGAHTVRSPEGETIENRSTHEDRSRAEGERLENVGPAPDAATDSFADANGNVVPATHYGMTADLPLEVFVTITFEELGEKTKITLRHAGFPVGPDRGLAEQGWSESFDKLADALAGGRFSWLIDDAGPENLT